MRILHCADIHLDATIESTLPIEKAQKRRQEVLYSFLQLFAYAEEHQVDVILAAGDLFDSDYISPSAMASVIAAVEGHPDIDFLYLGGNHDRFSKELFRKKSLPTKIPVPKQTLRKRLNSRALRLALQAYARKS